MDVNGGRCYYRIEGRDDRPAALFSHSLGLDHGMWDRQAADLLPFFRVIRYDTRGHGASVAPAGDYSIDELARDALALADALDLRTFAWCGQSLGGMIGLWLASRAPERLRQLVVANSTARLSNPQLMEDRRSAVLAGGMAAVADSVMARYFTPRLLESEAPVVAWARRTLLAMDPVGYAGCCAAIRDMDQTGSLAAIRTPTLIISGDFDLTMPWDGHGHVLAQSIRGATAVRLPAAHLSNLGRPRSFSAALLAFLRASPEVGLTRRLMTLTVTAALGQWREFRDHVRAGLEDELEPCDLEETVALVAEHAGAPAAETAQAIAAEELART